MNIGNQYGTIANYDHSVNTTNHFGPRYEERFDAAREALDRVPLTDPQRREVRDLLAEAAVQAGPAPDRAAAAVEQAQARLRLWGVVGTAGAGALTALSQIVTALGH